MSGGIPDLIPKSDFSHESIFSSRLGFLPKGYKKSDILDILNAEKIENMLIIKYKEILEKSISTKTHQHSSQNSDNNTIGIINQYIALREKNNNEKTLNKFRNLILEKIIIDFYDDKLPYLNSVKRIKRDFIFIYDHILYIAKDVELNVLTDDELNNRLINPIERFYSKIIDYAKKKNIELVYLETEILLSKTIFAIPYNIEKVKDKRNKLIELENKSKGTMMRGHHSAKDVPINNEKKVGLEAKNQASANLEKIKNYISCVANILREVKNQGYVSLTKQLFERLKILKETYERIKLEQEQNLYNTVNTLKMEPKKKGGKKTKSKRRKKNKNKTKRRKNKAKRRKNKRKTKKKKGK